MTRSPPRRGLLRHARGRALLRQARHPRHDGRREHAGARALLASRRREARAPAARPSRRRSSTGSSRGASSIPGTLLYPPNDHLAWLFAAHRERLSKVFVMYSPSEEAIITLLDKKRLHDACATRRRHRGAETHALGDAGADDPIADRLRYPVLLKPRTQVFLESGIKGFIVQDKADARRRSSRASAQLVAFNRVLTDRHPDIAEPMVQEYLTAAETSIFSVSGFVAEDGDDRRARRDEGAAASAQGRHRSLLRGPRRSSRSLVEKLAALCKKIGYYGAFESEFIVDGDRRLLIDFNPRFYSQMGFDIARGAAAADARVACRARRDARARRRARARARLEGDRRRGLLPQDDARPRARAPGPVGADVARTTFATGAAGTRPSRDGDRRRSRSRRPHAGRHRRGAWVQHFAKHPRSFVRSFVLNR